MSSNGESPDPYALAAELQANDPPKPKPGTEPLLSKTSPEILAELEEEAQRGDVNVVPTGWFEIDQAMGRSMRPPWVTVVAARTGVGKTWACQHLAEQAIKTDPGHRVVFLGMEMAGYEMGGRVAAHALGESPHDVYRQAERDGGMVDRVMTAEPRLEHVLWYEWGVSIDDLPRVYEGAAHGWGGVAPTVMVVDYLGLMRWAGNPRASLYEKASETARRMKDFAKAHNVLVIMAVQLNRQGGRSGDTEPTLDSLRDSGATEEAADLVLMLWREAAEDGRQGDLRCKVAKNRHGGYGQTWLIYDHANRLIEIPEPGEYETTPY